MRLLRLARARKEGAKEDRRKGWRGGEKMARRIPLSGHKVHWDARCVNKTLTTQQETQETRLGYFNI